MYKNSNKKNSLLRARSRQLGILRLVKQTRPVELGTLNEQQTQLGRDAAIGREAARAPVGGEHTVTRHHRCKRVACVVKLGSLSHDEFILSFCVAQALPINRGGGPPAAWHGPDLKISKTEIRNTSQWVLFHWFEKLQNECCTTPRGCDAGSLFLGRI